ncbi:MAG: PEP-utilizing enzyme [Candidatus Binatia bacterium]
MDLSKLTLPISPATSQYRVVILGAGRNIRGKLPAAMVSINPQSRVLDWLLRAFSALPSAQVYFVGGYMASTVMDQYPDIHFLFNTEWEVTGPAKSLALAPLSPTATTYVSYSDVVFRPESVWQMEALKTDLVLAVDTRWRVRYDRRSREELEGSEKVLCDGDRLINIGKDIPTSEAVAEFAGLMKMSAATAFHIRNAIKSGILSDDAGLPEVIRFLIQDGTSASVVDIKGDWAELDAPQDLARFVLGTKAESLERLKPLVRIGHIGDLVSFTHEQWNKDRASVLKRIQDVFQDTSLIVRSSALSEDSWLQSSAGAYKSIPDILGEDVQALVAAIDEVIGSYGDPLPENQALVQEMIKDVTISGVIMTRTPSLGAPYYVINFDNTTKRTDTVTSGQSKSLRTVLLHRGKSLRSGLPQELNHLMEAVQELEVLVGHDSLDIEFAFTRDGRAHILQVRPIAVAHRDQPIDDAQIADSIQEAIRYFRDLQKPSPLLVGRSTQFSVMSDWNPAEMIGTKPKRLAFSLYRYLITDEVWALQRAEYGYRDARPCNLLVDFLGHPYVDVRVDFNSFIPASLPDDLASRLVDYYLEHLSRCPELHDKVEFEVLFTCITFDFDHRVERLRAGGFSNKDIALLRKSLLEITYNGIVRCGRDISELEKLQQRFKYIQSANLPPLERAYLWLEDARRLGLPLFSHLARGAFIAVSLLRSLSTVGCMTEKQIEAFLASLHTVPSAMKEDAHLVAKGTITWKEFVEMYGHLRPGTYDITSPCYANAPEEYLRPMVQAVSVKNEPSTAYRWVETTQQAVAELLDKLGLGVDVKIFERFLLQAIKGREFSKFIFTRNLSAALETLAEFGAIHNISREELSHIRIQELMQLRAASTENVSSILRRLARVGKEAFYITQAVSLPSQIFSETDFVCFEQLKTEPNFVTRKRVRALVVSLSNQPSSDIGISGKVVLAPNADPGYDWLFTQNIVGLVTMYGGANSHMAVRAAEFQLPAAIGVGELLYNDISRAEMLELDCASRQIKVLR